MPNAHVHSFDEIIAFFGTDPDNKYNLYGEVEFWVDGEQFILHESSMFFIPRGTMHCPLIVRKVDKPIFHFTAGPGAEYDGRV